MDNVATKDMWAIKRDPRNHVFSLKTGTKRLGDMTTDELFIVIEYLINSSKRSAEAMKDSMIRSGEWIEL